MPPRRKKLPICKATGKRRFRDSIAAKMAIALAGRPAASARRDESRAYFCIHCRGYHLTSMRKESP